LGTPVKIIYRPLKMALTPQGRIFLEAHPDIYQRKMDFMALVKDLAQKNQLVERIDWFFWARSFTKKTSRCVPPTGNGFPRS